MTDRPPRRTSLSGHGISVLAGLFLSAVTGAVLLIVAELTTLYSVRVASSRVPIRTFSTGPHHAYALVPIALLAMMLALSVWREGSRPALLAIGLLGIVALLIALVGDLPDAHATGLIGNEFSHYQSAAAKPAIGLYIETLGAAFLIVTSTSGFILIGPPTVRRASRAPQTGGAGT